MNNKPIIIFVLAMIILWLWAKNKSRNTVTQSCAMPSCNLNYCTIARIPNSPAKGICVVTNSVVGPLAISPVATPIDQPSLRLSSVPGLPVPVPVGMCTKFLGLSTNPTTALAMIGAPVTRTLVIAGRTYRFSGTTQQVQAAINLQLKESGTNMFQVYVGGAIPGGGVINVLPS